MSEAEPSPHPLADPALLHEGSMDRRGLDADDLALQAVRVIEIDLDGVRLGPDEHGAGVIVLVGEVDRLLALVGDGHG